MSKRSVKLKVKSLKWLIVISTFYTLHFTLYPCPAVAQDLNTARSLEAKGDLAGAARAYFDFAENHPLDPQAASAYYRAGEIYFNLLRDYPSARQSFLKIVTWYPRDLRVAEAQVGVGDTYLAEEKLKEAEEAYRAVLRLPWMMEKKDLAQYRLGEADYFLGDVDAALADFQKVVNFYPRSLWVNDALGKIIFLRTYLSEDRPLFKSYARAEFEIWRKNFDQAQMILTALIKKYPRADYLHFKIGELYLAVNQPQKAIEAFQAVETVNPQSIFIPEAQLKLAEIYSLKSKDQAIKTYEQLVLKYPDSPLVHTAREGIERLREK